MDPGANLRGRREGHVGHMLAGVPHKCVWDFRTKHLTIDVHETVSVRSREHFRRQRVLARTTIPTDLTAIAEGRRGPIDSPLHEETLRAVIDVKAAKTQTLRGPNTPAYDSPRSSRCENTSR